MQPGWKTRAALWLVLAESARANRRQFPTLPTAWMPHLTVNTVALWLPELVAVVDSALHLEDARQRSPTLAGLYQTLRDICVDSPEWALYIAPSSLGYSVSHPRFNIYKGEMGELRFLGFGLDAIPHSAMAFTLTLLIQRGVAALERNLPEASPLSELARMLARQPALVSAAVLALLSAGWEASEMWAHREELQRMGGDASAINMEWSVEDTMTDLLSNALGWLAAATLEAQRGPVLPAALTSAASSD